MNSLTEKIGNLLSINASDKAIFSTYSRKCTNISNFEISHDDIKSFFHGDAESLKLSSKSDYQKVIQDLNEATSAWFFIDVCRAANVRLFRTEQERLKNNFLAHKLEMTDKARLQLERINERLLNVHREARAIWKDRGTHNLYLTKYFIIGISKSGKAVRAPLLMFNVDFKHDKRSEEITLVKRQAEPVLNEKLIQFFIQEAGEKNSLIKEFKNTFEINELVNKINKYFGYQINVSCPENIDFVEMRKYEVEDNYQSLVLEDGISFGIYEPTGGKLKEDLEHLVTSREAESVFNVVSYSDPEELQQQEMFWDPLAQISNLDFYQRCAVRSSVAANTIIHGPPGTGKSEVIVNIIANILMHDKNVVISSEKKAALDVLEKRLKSLNIFMLNFLNESKEGFYSKIQLLGEYIGRSWETRILDKHVDNPKRSNTYVQNKNIIDKFINNVKVSYDFGNHKYKNIDFGVFINEVKGLWGTYQNFESIIKTNAIHKLEEKKNEFDLPTDKFVNHLNDFCQFVDHYQLHDPEIFDMFLNRAFLLKDIVDKYQLNLDDSKTLNYLTRRNNYLSAFLNAYPDYEPLLKNKPNLFAETTSTVTNAMNDMSGLIHPTFFANKQKMFEDIHDFFDAVNNNKKQTKYYFDEFVYQNRKPWLENKTKIFYKRHFNKKDKLIWNHLQKLYSLQIDNIRNYEELFINQECFSPAVVTFHFAQALFNDEYVEFVTKRFYLFSLVFYKLQNILHLTSDKFNKTKELIEIYQYFMSNFPQLTHFASFDDVVKDLSKVDWSTFDKEIEKFVAIKLANRLSKLSLEEKALLSNAIRVAKLKRRPGIYEYIDKYSCVLLKLFRIWVCRPEEVATYVPLVKDFFDYGIFDEASQMFLERSYPLLYRAKIKVIAGDQKQLRPSSYFASRNNVDYDDEEDITSTARMEDFDVEESLLDRAVISSWNQTILQNHYRSLHKDLIKFSSEFIYDNKLNYASANLANTKDLGIEVINANGYFIERINDREADVVLQLLQTNIDKYKTVLIITSNDKQKEHIIRKIFNVQDPLLRDKYIEKWEAGTLEIINIENVQGNEADLVILSLCYGPSDASGRFAMRFGPLTAEGGENRLNVAVTRARNKMIVVKSFNGSQINSSTNNPHLITFKNYINFLDVIHDNQNVVQTDNQNSNNLQLTALQQEILNKLMPKLKEANLDYCFNYVVGNKSIDLAIIDHDTKQVVLGLEIDEWQSCLSKENIIQKVHDQMFLQARNYDIYRIVESEWFMHSKTILNTIRNLIDKKLSSLNQHKQQDENEKIIIGFSNNFPDDELNNEMQARDLQTYTSEDEHEPHFQSNFEQEVFEHLEPYIDKLDLKLLTQYQVYGKRIDIVIVNPVTKRVLLGIEVDGSRYHSRKEQIMHDFDRQKFLEDQGYVIHRISQTAWQSNKISVIRDVLAALNHALNSYREALTTKTRTLNLS